MRLCCWVPAVFLSFLLPPTPATGAETRERAKILAVNGGVVLQIGSRIEVLRDDGLPVRVIFDKIPPNLRAKPTLSITVDSDRAGTRPATLSYLTSGLGWSADYVSLYAEKAGPIDVQGWEIGSAAGWGRGCQYV